MKYFKLKILYLSVLLFRGIRIFIDRKDLFLIPTYSMIFLPSSLLIVKVFLLKILFLVSMSFLDLNLFFYTSLCVKLGLTGFNDVVSSNIPIDRRYTVFIKIRYDYDKFYMAGNQFGYHCSSTQDIYKLLKIVTDRLDMLFEEYKIPD